MTGSSLIRRARLRILLTQVGFLQDGTCISNYIYNALNTDAIVNLNQNFAAWLRPTEVLNPQLAKISVQFDF